MCRDAAGKCVRKHTDKRLRVRTLQGNTVFVGQNKSSRLGHLYYSVCSRALHLGASKTLRKGATEFSSSGKRRGFCQRPPPLFLLPHFCVFLSSAATPLKLVSHRLWPALRRASRPRPGRVGVGGRHRVGVYPPKALDLLSRPRRPGA